MGKFAIIDKRERRGLTWFGRLMVLIFLFSAIFTYIFTIHSFLAQTETVKADVLVVEGFIPDYGMEESKEIFEKGKYKLLIITGKPFEKGSHLSAYKNSGESSAATLIKLGMDSNKIRVVSLEDYHKRDRTYATALRLKEWIAGSGLEIHSLDLVTIDCHARRSRLLFQKVFGNDMEVGIISIVNRDYDPNKWWGSSSGFRTVIQETIAWIYARFLFNP
jgi:uncharacterized SAM-binding protein YcdF (DUF218 family)